ncbi:MAG: hypothetical protein KBS82_04845 [Oscillospiraceae bacterium]|nr:hypothetical protein [Candidatus Limimonas egerieequi]
MEGKLRGLFEYNRFSENARLSKLIEETDSRYGTELSDSDLLLVNAAGEPDEHTQNPDQFYANRP